MKVLIVDDEKLIRDVIKEYCIGNKYDVIEAENGVEADVEVNTDEDNVGFSVILERGKNITIKQFIHL